MASDPEVEKRDVIEAFFPAVLPREVAQVVDLSGGLAMAALVVSNDGIASGVEGAGEARITRGVFRQPVDDLDDGLGGGGGVGLVNVEGGSIGGGES